MKVFDSLNIFRIAVFGEKGIETVKRMKTKSAILFVLAVFIQSIPSVFGELDAFLIKFGTNAAIITISLSVVFTTLFIISQRLGSKIKFKDYFLWLSAVTFVVSFLSILTALLLINIGTATGYIDIAFNLIQGSLIVFYLFVVFAWCSERLAGFDSHKGVVVGLAALSLMYLFHLVILTLP